MEESGEGREGWICDKKKKRDERKERWVDEINRDRGENEARADN